MDDTDYEIELTTITHIYELRHACNLFGKEPVASALHIPVKKVLALYNSNIHDSTSLGIFLKKQSYEKFLTVVTEHEKESMKKENAKLNARIKNEILIEDLQTKRKNFAGIGTNKAKRRLNKLAKTDPIAKAIRLALEIEDKSISAKNSYGEYQDRIYNQKVLLVEQLVDHFKARKWIYGIQDSDLPFISHVMYFEIPTCEQISWHIDINKPKNYPTYKKEWDQKKNSTLYKLEACTLAILTEAGLLN